MQRSGGKLLNFSYFELVFCFLNNLEKLGKWNCTKTIVIGVKSNCTQRVSVMRISLRKHQMITDKEMIVRVIELIEIIL